LGWEQAPAGAGRAAFSSPTPPFFDPSPPGRLAGLGDPVPSPWSPEGWRIAGLVGGQPDCPFLARFSPDWPDFR